MRIIGPASADIVLVLRAATLSRRAGVAGCHATARAFGAVDLVLRRGDRVDVASTSREAGTLLVLVAAGLVRPDAGEAWSAPGGRLLRGGDGLGAHARGVAEGVSGWTSLAVCWADAVASTTLAFVGPRHAPGTHARRLCLERGALRVAGDSR